MRLRYFYNKWISPQRWLERAGIRAPMQIVIGLVLLTSCVLQFAEVAQLLPSEDAIVLRQRTTIAEMASMESASAVTHQNYAGARDVLSAMVRRYDDVLSAGLRRQDGPIVAETPNHEKYWGGDRSGINTPTHVQVLLHENQKPWGHLEISFAPLPGSSTWAAWWATPTAKLTSFILGGVFLLFWLFLSRMLKVLDPSAAIPQHVQVLMDTLVEGIVILDDQDRVVMTNQSFANTAFSPVERLIGRPLSALPWRADKGDGPPEILPWKTVGRSNLQQRGVPMRLQIGSRHTRRLTVNASPILDQEGTHLGVIVTFDDQTVVEAENIQLAQFAANFSKADEDIRKLLGELRSHADQDQLAKLDNLARVAVDLAQLCESASKSESKESKPTTTTAVVQESMPAMPVTVP